MTTIQKFVDGRTVSFEGRTQLCGANLRISSQVVLRPDLVWCAFLRMASPLNLKQLGTYILIFSEIIQNLNETNLMKNFPTVKYECQHEMP